MNSVLRWDSLAVFTEEDTDEELNDLFLHGMGLAGCVLAQFSEELGACADSMVVDQRRI